MPRQTSHESDDREEEDAENTFKILVATDCHLGYKEKDPVRSDDSLNTFEEILQHAQEHKVDMILLGGDLFHENKPSRKSLHGCMALLKKYCKGNKPVHFEYLTDGGVHFSADQFPVVHYGDPSANDTIPVFSIHGNHDDPAGLGNLCALDLLSVPGLVNHFGRSQSLERVTVSPVLLKKGKTKLALYGLGSIRDERLHQMFCDDKIDVEKPRESSNSWFNLLVIHQNRAERGGQNYIPAKCLHIFNPNLVVWGHEHECKLDECEVESSESPNKKFLISQPGSSIATSLCPAESKKKHVALLKITGKKKELEKIPLETVRPFCIDDFCLQDTGLDPKDVHPEGLEAFCTKKIKELIAKAADERSGNPKQPSLPLIRLRVDYSGGFSTFNINRFGQRFVNEVANTQDLIVFHKKREARAGKAKRGYPKLQALNKEAVEDLVKKYLTNTDKANQLELLSAEELCNALKTFALKKDNDAIHKSVKKKVETVKRDEKRRTTNDEDDLDNTSIDLELSSEEEADDAVQSVKRKVETHQKDLKKRRTSGDDFNN